VTELRAQLHDGIGSTVGRGSARAKILSAAIDAFAERGVAATRVEDLLQAADVSRRTFYQQFDDKPAVVHALFELVTQHLAATFAAAAARTTDPLVAIDEALALYLELHRTDRDIVRALLEEAQRAESPLYALRMRFRRDIARTLDAMVTAITRRRLDPLVALALVSAVEGVSIELLAGRCTRGELARARAVIASLIQLVCAHAAELPARGD
jgi:AcrR family transcriptional regulator